MLRRLKESPPLAALAGFVFATAVFAVNGYAGGRLGLRSMSLPAGVRYAFQLPAETIVLVGLVGLIWALGWWRESGLASSKMSAVRTWAYAAPPLMAMIVSVGRESLYDPLHMGTAWTVAPPSRILLVLLAAIVIALTEELYFRGILFGAVLGWGVGAAVVGSTVLFALVHASNALFGQTAALTFAQIAQTLLMGLLYAGLRLRTGSVLPAVAVHASVDFLAVMTQMSPAAALPPPMSPWPLPLPPMLILVALYGIWLVSDDQRHPDGVGKGGGPAGPPGSEPPASPSEERA